MERVTAILILTACLLVGCSREIPPTPWQSGDVVCVKLTGENVMVNSDPSWIAKDWVNPHGGFWSVRVRLGKAETTSSGLLGPTVREDRSYANVYFRDYELEDCP